MTRLLVVLVVSVRRVCNMRDGYLYEEMITEIAKLDKRDVVLVADIVSAISAALDVSKTEIRQELKKIKSRFFNNVVGFIDGEEVHRTTLDFKFKRIMTKLLRKCHDLEDKRVMTEHLMYYIQHYGNLQLGDIENG